MHKISRIALLPGRLNLFMTAQITANQDALYEFEQLKKPQDPHGTRVYTADLYYSTPGKKAVIKNGVRISVYENHQYGGTCLSILDEIPDYMYVEYSVKFGIWRFAADQLTIKGSGPKGAYTLTLS